MKQIDVAKVIGSPSALTQIQGDDIYHLLVSSFEKGEKVELDFSNVESMISPFLNNAIGQLYGKSTSEVIKEFLELKNFPSNKNATLNVVISNAKKFYSNKENYEKVAKDVFDIESDN